MRAASDFVAFILAGGKSTRMGTDKAFIELRGQTLLARVLETARAVTPDVRIVGDPVIFEKFAPTVPDIFRDCGPLGGIHAALRGSQVDLNLILAVDLPFLTPPLVQYLVQRTRDAVTAAVTAPRTARGWQPLCAVYRRQFTYIAEKSLRERRYKIDALFEPARTQAITDEELQAAGFSADLFRNLNTPEDLAAANASEAAL